MTNTVFKKIPNNDEGRTFIKVLKQSLRNTPYKVVVRGRGPRKPHVGYNGKSHRDLRQDLPVSVATHFSVYLDNRPRFRWVEQVETTKKFVLVPTKWGKPSTSGGQMESLNKVSVQ